jgi:ribosomal protein S27AE
MLRTRMERKADRARLAAAQKGLCPPCDPQWMAYHSEQFRYPAYWWCTRCHRRVNADVLTEHTAEAAAAHTSTLENPYAR